MSKVIIAGGRDMDFNAGFIHDLMWRAGFHYDAKHAEKHGKVFMEEVVAGGASGIDFAAETFAYQYRIPVKLFPADWATYGTAAGPIRNREMAEYGDALILIWDGRSRGSASMKREAEKAGIQVYEVLVKGWQ